MTIEHTSHMHTGMRKNTGLKHVLFERILSRGAKRLSLKAYSHMDMYIYIYRYKNMGRGQGWVAVGRSGG
jgi:hypothetical protein